MAFSLATYDPKKVVVTVNGIIMSGFARDKVDVTRDQDQIVDEVGADGEVVRALTNDRRGTITIKLLLTSPSNLVLSALAKLDEHSGVGVFPVQVQDLLGNDLHLATEAWIMRQAPARYSNRPDEAREWKIRTNNLQTIVGGHDLT